MSQISVKNIQEMVKTDCWAKICLLKGRRKVSCGILVSGFRNYDFPVSQMTQSITEKFK